MGVVMSVMLSFFVVLVRLLFLLNLFLSLVVRLLSVVWCLVVVNWVMILLCVWLSVCLGCLLMLLMWIRC